MLTTAELRYIDDFVARVNPPNPAAYKVKLTKQAMVSKQQLANAKALRNGAMTRHASQQYVPSMYVPRPGTELVLLLKSWGIQSEGCQFNCEAKAAEMDANGVRWCRENKDTIAKWLRDANSRVGWVAKLRIAATALATGAAFDFPYNLLDPVPGIVDEAIRRSVKTINVVHGSNLGIGLGDAISATLAVNGLRDKYELDGAECPIVHCVMSQAVPFLELFDLGNVRVVDSWDGGNAVRVDAHPGYGAGGMSRVGRYCHNLGGVKPLVPALKDRDGLVQSGGEFAGVVILAPFSMWAQREWPLDRWLVLEALLRQRGYRTIVADGTYYAANKNRHAPLRSEKMINAPARVVVGALLNAALLVSNDSGLAHVAGILGTDALVFSNVHSCEHVFGEYGRGIRCIQKQLNDISPGEVLDMVVGIAGPPSSQETAKLTTQSVVVKSTVNVKIISNYSPEWEGLSAITWPTKQAYAARHGFECHNLAAPPDLNWGDAQFSKGFACDFRLRQLASMNEGDWLWHIGCDAAVTGSQDVRDLIDGDWHVIVSTDGNGLNSDSILLRNSQPVRDLLAKLKARTRDDEQRGLACLLSGVGSFDEFSRLVGMTHRPGVYSMPFKILEKMNAVMSGGGVPTKVVVSRAMNAYPSKEYGLTGDEEWAWHPDDLVCHASGLPMSRRVVSLSNAIATSNGDLTRWLAPDELDLPSGAAVAGAESAIMWDGKRGAYFRDRTTDRWVWGEVYDKDEYGLGKLATGQTLLDIGGHIGAFAKKALELGAKLVVSVEPNPSSQAMWRRNLSAEVGAGRAILMGRACWSRGGEDLILRPNAVPGEASSDSVVAGEGAGLAVKSISFGSLLGAFRPDMVKVDCEGAEYAILASVPSLPDHVKVVWVEYHDAGKFAGEFRACRQSLTSQGFSETAVFERGAQSLYAYARGGVV